MEESTPSATVVAFCYPLTMHIHQYGSCRYPGFPGRPAVAGAGAGAGPAFPRAVCDVVADGQLTQMTAQVSVA